MTGVRTATNGVENGTVDLISKTLSSATESCAQRGRRGSVAQQAPTTSSHPHRHAHRKCAEKV